MEVSRTQQECYQGQSTSAGTTMANDTTGIKWHRRVPVLVSRSFLLDIKTQCPLSIKILFIILGSLDCIDLPAIKVTTTLLLSNSSLLQI